MRLVHYSRLPLSKPVYSVAQTRPVDSKPRGFWVSDDDCSDNWRTWCEGESFGLPNLASVHDVTLSKNARVLILRSAYEIDAFDRTYGDLVYQRIQHIDWDRVALDYQGIVITPYIWSRRLGETAGWYYGWDCASGCIWDADAIASITLRAQAGEAGTAETLLSGSVHKHAVARQSDAP